MVVESSDSLAQLKEGKVFEEYKSALRLLISEQLVSKQLVYLISYGSTATQGSAQGLPFTKFRSQ